MISFLPVLHVTQNSGMFLNSNVMLFIQGSTNWISCWRDYGSSSTKKTVLSFVRTVTCVLTSEQQRDFHTGIEEMNKVVSFGSIFGSERFIGCILLNV